MCTICTGWFGRQPKRGQFLGVFHGTGSTSPKQRKLDRTICSIGEADPWLEAVRENIGCTFYKKEVDR